MLHHIMPIVGVPHDGMPFTTPDFDNDVQVAINCAAFLGGSWWYTGCSVWSPTTTSPTWFCKSDSNWYNIKHVHIMVKSQ